MANALQAALPNRVSNGCLPIFLYLFWARARNKCTNIRLQFDSVNDESKPKAKGMETVDILGPSQVPREQ